MKKYFFLFLVFSLSMFTSCEKDNAAEEQLKKDIELIEDYLAQNHLTAQSTKSGLHYIILDQGTGVKPNIMSSVTVSYSGKLLDGTVFDSGFNIFYLSQLIKGWQEGLQLINAGGKIKLFVPSGLGYGSNIVADIPANSVLMFDIELKSVAN